MRPYEQIPDSVEGAYARVKELEAELKSVENQIASAYSSTALNDSMWFEFAFRSLVLRTNIGH